MAGRGLPQKMLPARPSRVLSRAIATAGVVLLALLVVVPFAALFSAVTPRSVPGYLRIMELPVTFWAIWAVVSLWAALDSSRLLRAVGRPVDPLSSEGFWGLLLGVVNVGASLAAVVLASSH